MVSDLRLAGQGGAGIGDAPHGDLYLEMLSTNTSGTASRAAT